MKKLSFIVLGAGNRGRRYTENLFKTYDCEIAALAEPNEKVRETMRQTYNIPADRCFASWEQALALGKVADFAIIATQDKMHHAPTLQAISLGYDILLEKPAAPTYEECRDICEAAEAKGVKVLVCHVLRYTPFFRKVKEIIDSGKLGRIMSVSHIENVGYMLQSTAFVRGAWRNSDTSSDMLLAKSCHDIDLLQWLMNDKCKKIQSFGSLSHFTRENCPPGAPYRCIEGCPHSDVCPYDATKLFLEFPPEEGKWVMAGKTDDEIRETLRTRNAGVCVYQMDNNVVDHQVVNMEFAHGQTVSFTMVAFGQGGRRIQIYGTKGELISHDMNTIELFTFCEEDPSSPRYRHNNKEVFKAIPDGVDQHITGGHGGGDMGIVRDLYDYFYENRPSGSISSIRTTVENHMLVFAAEESRKHGGVTVDFSEYVEKHKV